jgi:hypothetical protein
MSDFAERPTPDDRAKSIMQNLAHATVSSIAGHILSAESAARADERRKSAAQLLGNLLARIHRDGGQYITDNGWEKAVADADAKVVEWLAHCDAKPQRDRLSGELDPPVCRLQFPDGTVPGNAREAAEGWKKWADEFQRRADKWERLHDGRTKDPKVAT